MKKKSFTRFLCTSLSALACTAALTVTLSLTDPGQPENKKSTETETATEILIVENENNGNNPPDTPNEPGITPQNDWEKENTKLG